jgi:RNA polymerase sigma-70 factor (ECF subfamily)
VAAFIWGIGIRRLIDLIRRDGAARHRPPWRAAEQQVVVSAEDQVLAGLEHGRLGQALAGLSPELRAAIEATVLDGLSIGSMVKVIPGSMITSKGSWAPAGPPG